MLGAALLPGGSGAAAGTATVDVQTAGKAGKHTVRGPIGRPGPGGPRGDRGSAGPRGVAGRPGPTGPAAAPALDKQFVSIAWQNGGYAGKDEAPFVAPGIGRGEVRCTPPNSAEPNGVQWVRFFPYDNGDATTPPRKWATTMWTQRVGGNVDDARSSTTNVIRTARLDRANQQNGFAESFNTAAEGNTPESIGSVDGLITTEPFAESTAAPPPTSFRLSWHWNFRDPGSARCYMTATFVTEAS